MAMLMPVSVHAEELEAEESVYVAITDETEDFYSNEDIYNDSISLYDSEALALYEQYLEQAPTSISEGEDFAVAALEGFAQYAVDEGIIEDTVVQRATITKAVVRAEFKLVVAGGNTLGYTAAAILLNHWYRKKKYQKRAAAFYNMLPPLDCWVCYYIGKRKLVNW